MAAATVAGIGGIIVVAALLGGGSSDKDRNDPPETKPTASARQRKAVTPVKPSRPEMVPVALAGAKAVDYDPNGGNGEMPERVGALIDGDAKTEWQTELYPTGTFGRGVGAYVSLARPERLKGVEIRTSTPGWGAEVYVAAAGPPPALPAPGWARLGSRPKMAAVQRIDFSRDSKPVRHCLIWITKLPADGVVSIGEIRLFR